MDITSGFEPLIPGSSPGRCTSYNCGYGLVVEHVLAKDETGVRFPLPAQNEKILAFARVFSFIRISGDRTGKGSGKHLFSRGGRQGDSPSENRGFPRREIVKRPPKIILDTCTGSADPQGEEKYVLRSVLYPRYPQGYPPLSHKKYKNIWLINKAFFLYICG